MHISYKVVTKSHNTSPNRILSFWKYCRRKTIGFSGRDTHSCTMQSFSNRWMQCVWMYDSHSRRCCSSSCAFDMMVVFRAAPLGDPTVIYDGSWNDICFEEITPRSSTISSSSSKNLSCRTIGFLCCSGVAVSFTRLRSFHRAVCVIAPPPSAHPPTSIVAYSSSIAFRSCSKAAIAFATNSATFSSYSTSEAACSIKQSRSMAASARSRSISFCCNRSSSSSWRRFSTFKYSGCVPCRNCSSSSNSLARSSQ
uniref:Uncharacterized protein n=1 Tax=Anopheles coluzzii TaxID=1518534 RepID=A0A8W7PYZ5_ANOCL